MTNPHDPDMGLTPEAERQVLDRIGEAAMAHEPEKRLCVRCGLVEAPPHDNYCTLCSQRSAREDDHNE